MKIPQSKQSKQVKPTFIKFTDLKDFQNQSNKQRNSNKELERDHTEEAYNPVIKEFKSFCNVVFSEEEYPTLITVVIFKKRNQNFMGFYITVVIEKRKVQVFQKQQSWILIFICIIICIIEYIEIR